MTREDALAFVRIEQGEPDGFVWRIAEATRLDAGSASWGVVIPDDAMDPYQFLPETTARNGRGAGELPDGEFSVELVRIEEEAP